MRWNSVRKKFVYAGFLAVQRKAPSVAWQGTRTLAGRIRDVVERPQAAQTIATAAWEQSSAYTYESRARRILELVDGVFEGRGQKM